jgi:hypothetical protein
MLSKEAADELNQVCAGAVEMQEGGSTYIFLPSLTLGPQCRPRKIDALLRIASTTVNDYPTRLFFSEPIESHTNLNWNTNNAVIFQRQWFAFSWNGVINTDRPMEVLAQHLGALR